MDLEVFRQVGLFDPSSSSSGERRELLLHLIDRGYSVEDICSFAKDVAVTDLAAVMGVPLQPRVSARQLADRHGCSAEAVLEFRATLGVPSIDVDDASIPLSFSDDVALFVVACEQFGSDRTLGFARVVGGSVAALIEAGRELFATPLRESGATELEVSQANEFAVAAWRQLRDLIGRLMSERSARDNWFEAGVLAGDLEVAIAFIDLVDSTGWTSRVAPDERAAALGRFEHFAVQFATEAGGRVVKFIGDEAMLVGRDASALVDAAARLCHAAEGDSILPQARGAVSWGYVAPRSGDYYGDAVNLASRAAKQAAEGGIVVTPAVAASLDPGAWSVEDPFTVAMRGIDGLVQLSRVNRR